jgi:hypothetical protein
MPLFDDVTGMLGTVSSCGTWIVVQFSALPRAHVVNCRILPHARPVAPLAEASGTRGGLGTKAMAGASWTHKQQLKGVNGTTDLFAIVTEAPGRPGLGA